MDIKSIFELKLISVGDYELTLYHILFIAFIFIATSLLLTFIKKFLYNKADDKNIEGGKKYALFQIAKYVIWVIAISIMLDSVGINITLLVAGSAALLVGIGLGLQQVFMDFVSGIILLFEGSIKINDVVEIEGLVGRVNDIGIRTTRLTSREGIVTIIPNSKLVNDKVINWSHTAKSTRFSIEVGVAYGSDVELVKKVLLESATEMEFVESNPTPQVRFENFGDSSLEFRLLFWTDRIFRVEALKSDLRFMIDKKVRDNKIQIPFPQRDLHIVSGSLKTIKEDE